MNGIKLWQRRLFMVLAVLLLAGNLLTLYILEKNTSAFFYVYENRELYQPFRRETLLLTLTAGIRKSWTRRTPTGSPTPYLQVRWRPARSR